MTIRLQSKRLFEWTMQFLPTVGTVPLFIPIEYTRAI